MIGSGPPGSRDTGPHRTEGTRRVVRRLLRSPQGLVGVGFTLLVVGMALLAPLLTSLDPVAISAQDRLQTPSLAHPMGTDQLGRDVFSRVAFGGRVSILVAVSSVLGALIVSVVLGTLAAVRGGWLDEVVMRIMDVFFAFPSILLAIALISFLGPGPVNAALAIAIVFVAPLTRVVRSSVLTVRDRSYVEAARIAGAGRLRLMGRHILPNSMAPVIVQATVFLGFAIIIEASLSFIGLGLRPPEPSWGGMLDASRALLSVGPWIALFPGLAIACAVIGVNLLGDGLRDALDPVLDGS